MGPYNVGGTVKRALILGVGGQDGSYLADVLLQAGYEVHGLYRRSSGDNLWRIKHSREQILLHAGDMADPVSVHRIIADVRPREIYNEADQDSVGWSRDVPGYSMDITAAAVARTLESVRQIDPTIRFFQPCSSMMFGDAAVGEMQDQPQNEETRLDPQSPYACAKAAAFYLARHYRRQHNMHVSTAIFYNHDSPRRSEHYLLHKICAGATRIKLGKQDKLALGNLDARVDVGYALHYMMAAWRIVQQDEPDDFVIGTGTAHSVAELCEEAFEQTGVADWQSRIVLDPQYDFPNRRRVLVADCTKAKRVLGWEPEWDGVSELIELLINHVYDKEALLL